MTLKTSILDGLDVDLLLAEGLREPVVRPPVDWEPPTPGELRGLIPGHEISRLIGRGGMGAVYEARQLELDRRVAIKLLPAELSANESFAARFQREARIMGRLRHANLLPVFEFGRTTAGHLFFSTEYAEGGDLGAVLARGSLPPVEVTRLGKEICAGLEAAHAQGVIHRDIKPSNILLGPDNVAKLADFGLAVPCDRPEERLTRTGVLVGTVDYAAPEQSGGMVDARSDIYSVGVLLYELLTGKLPRGMFDPPSRLNPGVNASLDAVIGKALQPDPGRRYQQAGDLRQALEESERHGPRRLRLAALCVALILSLAAVAFSQASWRHQRERAGVPSDADTRIVSWGSRTFRQSGPPADLRDARAISVGPNHTLALRRNGTVVAWGGGVDGQLAVPAGLRDVRAIVAGFEFSVAATTGGSVVAWGKNDAGQTSVPADLTGVIALAAGWRHVTALREDGTVVVWGDNDWGQRNIPPGLADVRSISAGNAHTVALRHDGTVAAWGDDAHGQSTVPAGLTNVVAVAAGGFHNVAIRADGSFVAWGNNQWGQTTLPARLTKGKLVAGGYRHTIAVMQDGAIVAWGDNVSGQCNVPPDLTNVLALATGYRDGWAIVASTPFVPRPK